MGEPVVSPAVLTNRTGVRLGLCAIALVVGATGCGGVSEPDPRLPSPTTSTSPTAAPTTPVSPTGSPIPGDGVSLAAFGIQNGPAQFSLPRAALAASVVDQPNNVVLVLSAPSSADMSSYLRQTLPGAGFTITGADPGEETLRFDGHGWTGSFTTGEGASAILLRPR